MIEELRNIANMVEADEELTLELALMRLSGEPSYIYGLEHVPMHLIHYFAILCAECVLRNCEDDGEYISLSRAIHTKWSYLRGDVSNREMVRVHEEMRLRAHETYDPHSWVAYYLTPPHGDMMLSMIDSLLHTCCQCSLVSSVLVSEVEPRDSHLSYTASALYGVYTQQMVAYDSRINRLSNQLREKYNPQREPEDDVHFVDQYQSHRARHVKIFANVIHEYCDLLERVVGLLMIRKGKIIKANERWGSETEEALF
jgi:hypothetical protein